MEPEKQEIRNVSYYLAKFYEKQGVLNQIEGRFIFRGIPNANWSVASSAGRRLRREGSNKQADFIRYHINLIETARKFGYGGLESGSQLSDLEILAEIQHYGGATCLTDFSTNFLVALWFATEPIPHKENYKNDRTEINIETVSQDTDGKVIWLDLDNRNNFARISYYNQESDECSIYKILTNTESNFEAKQHKVEPCFWLWEPTKLNNRIIKQDSVFLFGLPAFPKDKADEKLIEKEDESGLDAKLQFKKIIIHKEDKEKLRQELSLVFGISAETVYYDFAGYAMNANGINVKINSNLLPKNNCLHNAQISIKKKQYSLAIGYIDEGLICKKSCTEDRS